jgi:Uma2 family endonuclease
MRTATLSPPPKSISINEWKPATWSDYVAICEDSNLDQVRVFFNQGDLWIDMGNEGINHARYNDLFTMIFSFWLAQNPETIFDSLSGCVIEKPNLKGAAPDKILYIGGNSPQWQPGEVRRINLDRWRVPDLVAEISDTTLATDLDEKKQLYASLNIPEYWVIDIRGKRVIAFLLQSDGKYQQTEYSQTLKDLPIVLLEQTLEKLDQGNNGSAGLWFAQQINQIKSTNS